MYASTGGAKASSFAPQVPLGSQALGLERPSQILTTNTIVTIVTISTYNISETMYILKLSAKLYAKLYKRNYMRNYVNETICDNIDNKLYIYIYILSTHNNNS